MLGKKNFSISVFFFVMVPHRKCSININDHPNFEDKDND